MDTFPVVVILFLKVKSFDSDHLLFSTIAFSLLLLCRAGIPDPAQTNH